MCLSEGADLLSVQSGSEDNFVYSRLFLEAVQSSPVASGFVWMGLTFDAEEKTLTWTDGSEVRMTNWARYEPGPVDSNMCTGFTYDTGHQSFQVRGNIPKRVC